MGTWDIGPFDNDTAADFGGDLDDAAMEERESMIRNVLKRAANPADELDAPDAERAVAAASLVVAQHPDGEPACSTYGPSEPIPASPPQTSERSQPMRWTRSSLNRLNLPSCGAMRRTVRNGAKASPASAMSWTLRSRHKRKPSSRSDR